MFLLVNKITMTYFGSCCFSMKFRKGFRNNPRFDKYCKSMLVCLCNFHSMKYSFMLENFWLNISCYTWKPVFFFFLYRNKNIVLLSLLIWNQIGWDKWCKKHNLKDIVKSTYVKKSFPQVPPVSGNIYIIFRIFVSSSFKLLLNGLL